MTIGSSRNEKVLRPELINKVIDNKTLSNTILLGSNSDLKYLDKVKSQIKTKDINLNKNLIEVFKMVQSANTVISYDTGLFHIAQFLNKDIILILNKDFVSYKYLRNY